MLKEVEKSEKEKRGNQRKREEICDFAPLLFCRTKKTDKKKHNPGARQETVGSI